MELTYFVSNPLTWIILILVFLISYNYIVKESWRGLPPGPPALPLVGSLPFLGADIREDLRKMAAKYGDVFTVYFGKERVVVLNSYATLKEAHLKHKDAFLGRPANFNNTFLGEHQGITCSNGSLWHDQRNFALSTFRNLGFGRAIMENRITDEIQYFIEELLKQKDVTLYPNELLPKSVANVLAFMLFGKRMEYTDPSFIKFVNMTQNLMTLASSSGILQIFPSLRHLPGDLFGAKALLRIRDDILMEHQRMIDQLRAESEKADDPTDFIGAYLQKIKAEKDNPESTFTEKHLCYTITDIIMAGTETTATTLTWGILYMSLHPDIQTRVQQEIDDVIGKEVIPSMRHRLLMPYTEACLNEIQRLGDITPLALPRTLVTDVTLRGYFLPKGSMVISNLNESNYDARLWPEPDVFRPERFLDEDGKIQRREALIPFMIGKRACAGEHFARMALFLYFTSMLANVRFRLAPGYPEPDSRGVFGATNQPNQFHVITEPRG